MKLAGSNWLSIENKVALIIPMDAVAYTLECELLRSGLKNLTKHDIDNLIISIKRALLEAIISYISLEKKESKSYTDCFHQSVDFMTYSGIPLEVAGNITNHAETLMIKAIIDIIPNLEDLNNVEIIDYKINNDGDLFLVVKIKPIQIYDSSGNY